MLVYWLTTINRFVSIANSKFNVLGNFAVIFLSMHLIGCVNSVILKSCCFNG